MFVAGHIAVLLHHVSSAAVEFGPQFAIERRLKEFDEVRRPGRFKSTFAPIFSICGDVCNVHCASEIIGERRSVWHSFDPEHIVVLNLDICDRSRVFERLFQANL